MGYDRTNFNKNQDSVFACCISFYMEQSNVQSLILTGGSLGVLHVLAGPDHLSALAALSVGSSWRAINLGIKWGIGHSTGELC
jgi:hypothetical protein